MFEQKERCINCKHLETVDICYFCGINHEEIEHPYQMGGSYECECYEKTDPKQEPEFEYPKISINKLKFTEWSNDNPNQKIVEMREKDVTFENVRQLISEMEKQGFEITSFGHIFKFKKA